MEARNCPRCGKIFNYVSRPVCNECHKKEEDSFKKLKEFIDENPDCTLSGLSDGTSVPPKRILRYIREGRLEITKGMHGEVKCERCGASVTTGRYCDACVIEINQSVNELYTQTPINKDGTQRGAKMHIHPKRF